MKIASLRTTIVSVPTVRPCAWSRGTGVGFTRTILELETDRGLVGLGECEGASAAELIRSRLARKLNGVAVDDLDAARQICHIGFADYGSLSDKVTAKAFAAIEMAMLDAAGKAHGLPVYRLLGGATRPQARFGAYGYTFHLPTAGLREQDVPAAMARFAADAIARTGAAIFEFKVGRFSPETDIETIREVRRAVGPSVALGVDANQAYEMDRARRVMRAVADCHLDWFEEPVESFDDLASLRARFDVPLSSHCCDLEKLRYYPAIDGVVGDLHLHGGMTGLPRLAAGTRALGRRFWQRACLELGISWAAMVHVGVACPDLTRESQALIDWVEDDLTLGPTWLLRDGGVIPPEKPGLGVELDRDALAKYAERYCQVGEQTYFELE